VAQGCGKTDQTVNKIPHGRQFVRNRATLIFQAERFVGISGVQTHNDYDVGVAGKRGGRFPLRAKSIQGVCAKLQTRCAATLSQTLTKSTLQLHSRIYLSSCYLF